MISATATACHLTLLDNAPVPVDAGSSLPFDPAAGETARERLLFDALDRRQRRAPVLPALLYRGRYATGETLVIIGYGRLRSGKQHPQSIEAMQFDNHDRLLRTWVVVDRRRVAAVLRTVHQFGSAESPAVPCVGRLEVRFELDAAVA